MNSLGEELISASEIGLEKSESIGLVGPSGSGSAE